MRDDAEGVRTSGLAGLEDYVRTKLVKHKRVYLEASSARNVSALLADLVSGTEMALGALTLPLADLDEKMAVFEDAIQGFSREQQSLNDLLSGEWRRTLSLLDRQSAEAEKRVRAALAARLDTSLDPAASQESQRSLIHAAMTELCDKELRALTREIQEHVHSAVAIHRQHYDDLVQRVHETAATLMQVSAASVPIEEGFQATRVPYWSSRALAESLGAVTGDWLALMLPRKARQRRMLRKLRDAAFAAVGRNIAGLHWAMHQNIDDTFRRLLAASGRSVEESFNATRDILAMARERRNTEDAALREEVDRTERTLETLRSIQRALARLQAVEAGPEPASSP
jgi:hypothetical protein